ncbi:MAG: CRISPR-associated endonuclease Cas1 [Opitutales bacterium]|jgi:CRISPR-associated protein Cas1|nr:CRISPR-associated endonuclease Cas1 [Opitutales bacterium]
MSYHILHISEHGCGLSKERGLLVCRKDGKTLGKIAIEDLRAVVILGESVNISAAVFAGVLDNDAIIIHCRNYKAVGVSVPNSRTYDARVVLNQAAGNRNLNAAIWRRLLRAKVENCARCLRLIGVKNSRLEKFVLSKRDPNEAWCAREYWKHYFPRLGESGQGRVPQGNSSPVNLFLNYGYGILGGIVHRSLIVAGLNCLLGVNHKTYYKNTPLVYDAIEPFRAFADYALCNYMSGCRKPDMREWSVFFGKFLKDMRVKKGSATVKLMDAADVLCESIANAYRYKKAELMWLPVLD